ncbi:MAG TPA: glycosyltransferase family 2 protein [Candidatus Paceibacterota bacterium]|nr:glycosyltransferase family 2 protein [Candidatus Paceibacterota bacterium]
MLTILTVNYRSATSTIALLRSLERQTRTDFDVIVVDNDSPAADRAALAAYAVTSPLALDIILSDTNRGFSGGNNLGIRKALAQGSPWLMFINPDTTAPSDMVASLMAQMEAGPGIVGVPLREGGRITRRGIVRWLSARLEHAYEPAADTTDAYAVGAGMLIHRDVIDAIGLMDERYFLYFEDAEFSVRARQAGYDIRFAERPVITHAVSATTSNLGVPRLLHYHVRNALLFNASRGPWWVRVALPFWAASIMARQLMKLAIAPNRRTHARAIMAGVVDHYRGHYGIIT